MLLATVKVIGVAILFALTSCTGGEETLAPPPPPSTTTPPPPPKLAPDGRFTLFCAGAAQDDARAPNSHYYSSLAQAWSVDARFCYASWAGDGAFMPTVAEQNVYNVVANSLPAPDGSLDVTSSVEKAYTKALELCAQKSLKDIFAETKEWSSALLAVCPGMPNAQLLELRSQGNLWPEGAHRIGLDNMPPGVYVADVPLASCRWERIGTGGMHLAGGYAEPNKLLEVNLLETDATFSSTDCGFWVKQS